MMTTTKLLVNVGSLDIGTGDTEIGSRFTYLLAIIFEDLELQKVIQFFNTGVRDALSQDYGSNL